MIDLKLNRGFTYLKALGGYQQDEKRLIYLVVSPREVQNVKKLIEEIDPNAFVNIIEVHEALGEGFTYKKPKRHLLSIKNNRA